MGANQEHGSTRVSPLAPPAQVTGGASVSRDEVRLTLPLARNETSVGGNTVNAILTNECSQKILLDHWDVGAFKRGGNVFTISGGASIER